MHDQRDTLNPLCRAGDGHKTTIGTFNFQQKDQKMQLCHIDLFQAENTICRIHEEGIITQIRGILCSLLKYYPPRI